MDPNNSIPPPPPPPSETTFVASPPQLPKKKAHPLLVAFLVLFILFDIGIGALVFLNMNKKQTATPLLKTQETDSNTATEDQTNNNTNVKQESITSLAAPNFQNKILFQSLKALDKMYTINPDGTGITEITIPHNLKGERFVVLPSPSSNYLLIMVFKYPAQNFYLYSLYKKTLEEIGNTKLQEAMQSKEFTPLIASWSSDDKQLLFRAVVSSKNAEKTAPSSFWINYDINSKKATLLQLQLPNMVSFIKFYSKADQTLIYLKSDPSQVATTTNSTWYYRDLKTNTDTALPELTYLQAYHGIFAGVLNHGTYYVSRSKGNNDEQKMEIFSIKDSTKSIRTITVPLNGKDEIIQSVVWSNDYHYLAVTISRFDKTKGIFSGEPSLRFYTFEGEEVMRVDLKELNDAQINAQELPTVVFGTIFAANNKYVVVSTYQGKTTNGTFSWRTYDLEKRKIISEKFTNENFPLTPLAWY